MTTMKEAAAARKEELRAQERAARAAEEKRFIEQPSDWPRWPVLPSRKVDTANQYHLWVFPEGVRLPFGFASRLVHDAPETECLNIAHDMHAKQRPFEGERS